MPPAWLPQHTYPALQAWGSQCQTPCSSHLRFVTAMSIATSPHLLLRKVVGLVGHHVLQAALPLRHALGGHHHAAGHPLLHHLWLVTLQRQSYPLSGKSGLACMRTMQRLQAVSQLPARPHEHGRTTCCLVMFGRQPQVVLPMIPAKM